MQYCQSLKVHCLRKPPSQTPSLDHHALTRHLVPAPAQTLQPPQPSPTPPKPTTPSNTPCPPPSPAKGAGSQLVYTCFPEIARSSVYTFSVVSPGKSVSKKVYTDRVSGPDRCILFLVWFYPVKVPQKYTPIAAGKSGADWSGGGFLGQVRFWSGVLA